MTFASPRPRAWPLLGAVAVLAACGRDPAPSPLPLSADASIDASSATHRPPRPPPGDAADGGLLARRLPHIEYRGGPFLRHAKLVTITFTKDDPRLVSRLEQLGSILTRSAWWRTVVDGYCAKPDECVGEGSAGPPVHLDETLAAESSDSDVEALLLRAAKARRFGALDDNTLLLLYLPSGIGLHDATTRYCNGGPRAFHRSLEVEGKRVAFAVLPRCGGEEELTGTASHEILEAATNPFPVEHGFSFVGGNGPSGFTAAGVEPVDPCGLVTMDRHWTTESGFVVHRAWSNRAAALGLDPCVPSRPEIPYVMLVPRDGAVRLAREGDSVTVDLDASTALAGAPAWAVSAFDLSGYHAHEQYLELSLDRGSVTAGESVKLTIKARKMNPQQRGVVALVSTVGVHSHMWPLVVMMR